MMWSQRYDMEIYVYWNGQLIYKRWLNEDGGKRHASVLFNEQWPTEWITSANDKASLTSGPIA